MDNKKLSLLLSHIDEKIEKGQYWNAIATCSELMQGLCVMFNEVLKQRINS